MAYRGLMPAERLLGERAQKTRLPPTTGSADSPTMSNTRLQEMIETKCPRFLPPQQNNGLHCEELWHTHSQGRHKDGLKTVGHIPSPPPLPPSPLEATDNFCLHLGHKRWWWWGVWVGPGRGTKVGAPCSEKYAFVFLSLKTSHYSTEPAAAAFEHRGGGG